ncbi:MAG: hypothetical protein P1U86_05695 [Verrucomicrobiales bacterium]|nr:hypothetical protein [Verrucomicrobiales bacterium]
MHSAYQIEGLESWAPEAFMEIGRQSEKNASDAVTNSIDRFVRPNGSVDAATMMEDWFPNIAADVFISHCRADKDTALALSGWLKDNFGLSPFIDSCVWNHAHDLIRLLDDKYCQTGVNTYSYSGSLVTASHVHLMLSTALTKMMDRCECIFFLRTPNSIGSKCPEKMVNGDPTSTYSPWLFHEIAMMKLLRIRTKDQHRSGEKLTELSEGVSKSVSVPSFTYPAELSGIPTLNRRDLIQWESAMAKTAVKRIHPLDLLYKTAGPG